MPSQQILQYQQKYKQDARPTVFEQAQIITPYFQQTQSLQNPLHVYVQPIV